MKILTRFKITYRKNFKNNKVLQKKTIHKKYMIESSQQKR